MLNLLKRNLDTAVNIATLICIVSLIAFFGYRWAFPQNQQNNYKEDFAEGKTLAEVPNLNEDSYEKSVILILNTDCKYCNASMGFYKKLASVKYDTQSKQLVALFLQPQEVVNKYVNEKGFPVRSISSASFEKLKVGLTPTIVVVNNRRQIIKSWFGQLEVNQEGEVIDLLEK